jgi:hypothetical protein
MQRVENSLFKTHGNNLDKYYEYRIYDRNIGNNYSEYAPCPIVMMSRHQGFQWNDELFVSAYRRSAGYECHKSTSLQSRDNKVMSTSNTEQNSISSDNDHSNTPEVIDIKLTEADCDVWP